MSKFAIVLIATGLGLGVNTGMAQNVDSDKAKAQGQDKVMQEKEQTGAAQGGASDTDRERTNRRVEPGSARGQSGQNPATSQTDGAQPKQGGANNPGQDQNSQKIPAQSNGAVGKPLEQKSTGQGQGADSAKAKMDQPSGQNQTGQKADHADQPTAGQENEKSNPQRRNQ